MSQQISSQSNKVWKLVSDPGTAATYREAITLTGTILKETGILLWLILCLVLVVSDWFWTNSIAAGRNFRRWINSIEEPNTNGLASEAGKAIVLVSKTGFAKTISQAREQLGLPQKQEAVSLSPAKEPAVAPTVPTNPPTVKPSVATEPVETKRATPPTVLSEEDDVNLN